MANNTCHNLLASAASFLLVAFILLTGCGNGTPVGGEKGRNGGKPSESEHARLPGTFRLATYNVHVCTPIGGPVSYDNIAKVISLMDPDVIALQELDRNNRRNDADQLAELEKRTEMDGHFCKAINYRDGEYGIGMLWTPTMPPISIADIDLPGAAEARKALVAQFEDFIFICTHLSLSSAERVASRIIIDDYLTANFPDYDKPIYLAGDLNEESGPGEFYVDLTKSWTPISSAAGTFISNPLKRIDFILVSKSNDAKCEVASSAVPTFSEIDIFKCSDHLPVMVDIKK